MGLRTRLVNALNSARTPKQKNSVSGRSFLLGRDRYKGNDILLPTWDEVKLSNTDLYKGYSYAVIQKRGNKVATLARDNLKTWVKPEALDAFQKHEETPLHPYLRIIENSEKFTEKRFWKDISIYLDLTGVYYLGVVRNRIQSRNPEKFPDLYSNVTEFIMLNPYEVHRIINSDGVVGGYIERKPDGRERIWPVYQIIEMRELNPFDDRKTWSMSDAAKESIYTIRQSGDYARQALNGNLDSPGILTTDVILEDDDFDNFKERVRQHRRGEPIFGNGSGAINWTNTQVNLDQAALPSLNDIYRTTLFAVSGTSKTALGIEQSGTTRETARVQNENFAQDTALPRLEDIVDFLNLDYKQKYKNKYNQIGYTIEVNSVSGTDYQTENQATEVRSKQFTLSQDIIYAGYTEESARQYAMGEIELTELEASKLGGNGNGNGNGGGDESNPPENPETPENPTEPVVSTPSEPTAEDTNAIKELEEIEPHADLKNSPKAQGLEDTHICEDCEESPSIDFYENRLSQEDNTRLNEAYQDLLKEVKKVQKETLNLALENVTVNAFEESDLLNDEQKETLTKKLKNLFQKYWKVLFPLFAGALVARRNQEFGSDYKFKFTNELEEIVDENGIRVADGHMDTILKDILKVTNKTYEQAIEKKTIDLIAEAYEKDPAKFSAWFAKKPTKKQIKTAIQETDILDINRRIYERANRLATEGEARAGIVQTIRREFNHLSKNRAELIARNETSRAFGHSQYDADYQFLNSIGRLGSAYKELYSRSGNPCEFCQAIINQGPIPFTQNFLGLGETITVDVNGKIKSFTANYEDIKASTIHPNCFARDTQVYTNEGWKRVDELTGKELFWSIDPDTQKPEWVKAKTLVRGYAEKLIRYQNKNFDMATTFDHNMFVSSEHRVEKNKLGKTTRTFGFKEAQNLANTDKFYSGVNWTGVEPETIKLGDYDVPTELYCKFMGYYLSEGSAGLYKNGKRYQAQIAQRQHHDEFWNTLQKMPFTVWNGKHDFTVVDKSVVKHLMSFGKCNEKYIPNEIKQLSPRLLKVFLDAFVLGDGHRKFSAYSNAWATTISTSSVRLRDDLTEVAQKAGFRPTIKLLSKKGTQYKGTNYFSNHDVWQISLCNKVFAYKGCTKKSIIDYHDDVFCVELEKNHTLYTMYNGKCWWSGNCNCSYRLVFLDGNGKVTSVYNSLWGEKSSTGDIIASRWLNTHSNHTTKEEVRE